MKKFLVYSMFIGFVLNGSNLMSQTEFGIKGGINLTFFNVIEGNFGPNADVEAGYYAGIFADFWVNEGFHFQPELLYINIDEFRFLNAPLYLKYDINNNFHILVGPSLNYFFDFFTNKFKVRADIALDYDISSRLGVHMKYTLGFQELAPHVIFLGMSYRL